MARKISVRRSSGQHQSAGTGMEPVCFTLPAEMKRQLEQRAQDRIVTTSHLLRQLVRAYLKNGASRAASTPDLPGGGAGASRAA